MTRYVIRRLLVFVPAVLAILVLVALMIDLIPGDPAKMIVGKEASGESLAKMREQLGLDRPMYERLGKWLLNAMRGDLGTSYFLYQPVAKTIAARFNVTLYLAVLSTMVATLIGISGGILVSIQQGKIIDWVVTTSALVWLSLPAFLVALTFAFIFAVKLDWLPLAGFVSPKEDFSEFLTHIILPVMTIGLSMSGVVLRFTRTSMLEVLNADYIRTARAKGLSSTVVLVRHALRNALIPILTIIGIEFGESLGGAVLTESVFAMPGIGRMTLDAVKHRDFPLIQGGMLVITVIYLAVNLIVDLLYALVDPRIRYD